MTREEIVRADKAMKAKALKDKALREQQVYNDVEMSVRALWLWAEDNGLELTAQMVLDHLPQSLANSARWRAEEAVEREARALRRREKALLRREEAQAQQIEMAA